MFLIFNEETFKEFHSMLLNAVLHVHTDHYILSLIPFTETQRVLRWRLYIEEYLLFIFHNMKGTDNVLYYNFYLSLPEA